ncbi:hypothetical protein [Abyssogena phaseoliformis symbiont]|uniref:hypothetical protein n=1 Tax=Abyssogena phaseoliformis symbiont TaxID=596095 RepID=UPI00191561A7|nr:hypothetical protein [Abyssogena phaseoliformis symbiont]
MSDAKARTDLLLGIEYSGITDGSIGYKVAIRNIHDYSHLINIKSNGFKSKREYQQVVRFNQFYFNQTLDLTVVISVFGKSVQVGGSARVSFDYVIDDQTSISGGVIDYMGGDLPVFEDIKNNDRIFAKVSFLF